MYDLNCSYVMVLSCRCLKHHSIIEFAKKAFSAQTTLSIAAKSSSYFINKYKKGRRCLNIPKSFKSNASHITIQLLPNFFFITVRNCIHCIIPCLIINFFSELSRPDASKPVNRRVFPIFYHLLVHYS